MSKNEALAKLESWLKRRGFKLVIRPEAVWAVDQVDKIVYGNNTDYLGMDKVAVLLHECGHIIRLSKTYVPPRKPPTAPPRKGRPTDSWYIGVVQEEMEAWDEGVRLASKLGIKGAHRAIVRTRARCLMHYMSWASAREDHKWMDAANQRVRSGTKQEKDR